MHSLIYSAALLEQPQNCTARHQVELNLASTVIAPFYDFFNIYKKNCRKEMGEGGHNGTEKTVEDGR